MSHNTNPIRDPLHPYYPRQHEPSNCCAVNNVYQTLPESSDVGGDVQWEITATGPTSIKHIYPDTRGVSPETISRVGLYPYQRVTRPVGTLYDHDFSQYHQTGVGVYKRTGYHYKVYPFTNRHVREERTYANQILPYMDSQILSGHPDTPLLCGDSVNSPYQTHPHSFFQK